MLARRGIGDRADEALLAEFRGKVAEAALEQVVLDALLERYSSWSRPGPRPIFRGGAAGRPSVGATDIATICYIIVTRFTTLRDKPMSTDLRCCASTFKLGCGSYLSRLMSVC